MNYTVINKGDCSLLKKLKLTNSSILNQSVFNCEFSFISIDIIDASTHEIYKFHADAAQEPSNDMFQSSLMKMPEVSIVFDETGRYTPSEFPDAWYITSFDGEDGLFNTLEYVMSHQQIYIQ